MTNRNWNRVEVGILDYSKFEHRIETYLHALRRYQFASEFVRKDNVVVDVCCGSGYGTAILKEKALRSVGIDRNIKMISYAREHYMDCEFICLDINSTKFMASGANVFTAFECLDHLQKVDAVQLINRIADSCQNYFLASLPCDHKRNENKYHLCEWEEGELECELRKYFATVLTFGQSWSTGLISYPFDERRSMTVFVAIK